MYSLFVRGETLGLMEDVCTPAKASAVDVFFEQERDRRRSPGVAVLTINDSEWVLAGALLYDSSAPRGEPVFRFWGGVWWQGWSLNKLT